MRQQHTLARAGRRDGVGLHTGAMVGVELRPAAPGSGLCVVRDDVPGAVPVRADVRAVRATRLGTVLGGAGWQVSTVEHLLAALLAEGVDNAEIGVTGPEVPVLDGSSMGWIELIRAIGLVAQEAPRRQLVLREVVEVQDGPRRARLSPAEALELCAWVRFEHPDIGEQSLTLTLENGTFSHELAWARTFGFLHEVEAMHAAGLGRGGSLDNAVVYGPDGVLNPEGTRAPDEVVRHKLLDMVGDLALVGLPVRARYEAWMPGHALTTALVAALLERPHAWEVVEG